MTDLMTKDLMLSRKRTGRRPTRPTDYITAEVQTLIDTVKNKEPHLVAQHLRRQMNSHLDEELEVLATFVLSSPDFDAVVDLPEVIGPLGRGQPETAMRALVSRMRRKVAKMLRDHQRGEADDFLDDVAIQVD